jgi:hypothetical protein
MKRKIKRENKSPEEIEDDNLAYEQFTIIRKHIIPN